MKSKLTEKLLSICGNSNEVFGIEKLTEEQRIQIETELINHFEFEKIIWLESSPDGLGEDGTTPLVAKSLKISDLENPKYKHKVGYVYTISFTPTIYDPMEIYKPVKDGCVFGPIVYNPETFEPTQSITLTWSPEFAQEFPFPTNEEVMKQSLRDRLEKVLNNPEEYKPEGYVGCIIRYTTN
jgi:hypothetical protein